MVGVTGETVRDRMRQTWMIKEEKDLTTHSFRIDADIKSRELVYWSIGENLMIFRRYYYIQKMAVIPTPRMSVSTKPQKGRRTFFLKPRDMCVVGL